MKKKTINKEEYINRTKIDRNPKLSIATTDSGFYQYLTKKQWKFKIDIVRDCQLCMRMCIFVQGSHSTWYKMLGFFWVILKKAWENCYFKVIGNFCLLRSKGLNLLLQKIIILLRKSKDMPKDVMQIYYKKMFSQRQEMKET